MKKILYWPHMYNKRYATVRDFQVLAQDCTYVNKQWQLKKYYHDSPPVFIGMDVLAVTKEKARLLTFRRHHRAV